MSRFDDLALRPPVEPMESRAVVRIPEGDQWIYEPKWDGFRCLAFRSGDDVELESKSGQSLTRYFPEIVEALLAVGARRFAADGELVVEGENGFDFDALLQRIHPAESRVRMLAQKTPARYAIFDLLVDERNAPLYERLLSARRERLDAFAKRYFTQGGTLVLSPATHDLAVARSWLAGGTARLDGVIAKDAAQPYAFGRRDAVLKIKRTYTADCVIGGFRASADGSVASLLLGLYDGDRLDHVGFVGSMTSDQRKRATALLRPIVQPPGFTGTAPGGPSRWRKGEAQWFPVAPTIVVEVAFDHVTARRFRHGARLLRWRPDKSATQCTIDQLLDPS
jgi:ATP-dependent DNA ligase